MTVEEQVTNQKLQLDEQSQADILESELGTDVENLSSKLGGYQLNSEKKKAWITSINPSEDLIEVEFLLPSTDKFVTRYDIPNKRLPEDNLFRKLIEDINCKTNTLELAIGESIDIRYNESIESWEPEIHKQHRNEQNNVYSSSPEPLLGQRHNSTDSISSLFMIVTTTLLMVPILLVFLRYTRFVGVIALLIASIGYILISKS